LAKKRKILVFAHVPPPHHGQSVMVQVLLEGLRADPLFEVHHVNARVSDDLEDVGAFRPLKILRLLKCILQAWWVRLRYGRMAFYYVPAPAKRSAILRDWVVMALCRPLFSELILHWHAYGLGEWVASGKDWQRRLTRCALGKADLSIVLNEYNKRDAEVFAPKRVEVVPNGIADQFPDFDERLRDLRQVRAARLKELVEDDALPREQHSNILKNVGVSGGGMGVEVVRFLFLGHLIETKGVFVATEATRLANEELRKSGAAWRAFLTLAGSFTSEEEKARVLAAIEKANEVAGGGWLVTSGEEPSSAERLRVGERSGVGEQGGAMIELVGFLDSGQKKSALERADCLVFPTFYENEAQPLVLLEAMSAGLPVITTSWRGVAEVLPEGYPAPARPQSAVDCADCMLRIAEHCRSEDLRRQFVEHFTLPQHVASLLARLT